MHAVQRLARKSIGQQMAKKFERRFGSPMPTIRSEGIVNRRGFCLLM